MLYKSVLTSETAEKSKSVIVQIKATEQYFPVVLFIMRYKVVYTFKSLEEILPCDYLNENLFSDVF